MQEIFEEKINTECTSILFGLNKERNKDTRWNLKGSAFSTGLIIIMNKIHQLSLYDTAPSKLIVYDLKFVGPLEFELVAPMPEQLKTTTMHFYEAPRKPY